MIKWIDSSSAFAEYCRSLPPGVPVAVDTEFDWQRSYYPVFALLQIGVDRENAALVDPFAVDDWTPLKELLTDSSRRKILFSGGNDLPILVRACGGPEACIPANVFDVQSAYLFLGESQNVALKWVVKEELDIELDKSETRSDWTMRPLTAKQLEYAAGDVVLLPEVAQKVEKRLQDSGNLEFFLEEMAERHCRPECYQEQECEKAYARISGYWRIERADVRARLRGLAFWREQFGRANNISRSRIFKDAQLVWIAEEAPSSTAVMGGMPDYRRQNVSRYGADAIAAMRIRIPEPPSVPQHITPQMKSDLREMEERLIKLVSKRAAARGIASTLVAARRDVEKLAFSIVRKKPVEDIPMLGGWRRKILDPAISSILEQ
ncbi:MAG: HRDC domain-containing protein [Victivallales bacterium]|nr:HRDC domain-containing protein [Victivallales bacterium]